MAYRLLTVFAGLLFMKAAAASPPASPSEPPEPLSQPAASFSDALSGASADPARMRWPVGEGERIFRADELPAREGDFWIAFEDAGAGEDVLRQSLAPLVGLLRERYPERRVVVARIPSGIFAEEVRRQKIPFVMAASGTMVSLMQNAEVVPLASRGTDAGALLVVRVGRETPTLGALEGTRLVYADSALFGPKAWLDVRLLSEGWKPDQFWSASDRRARVLPDVLTPLALGRADAALLPGCLWEKLLEDGLVDAAAFRPVGAQSSPGRCLSSTARYPDWMLGYAPSASDETLRQLAAVVFELGGEGRSGSLFPKERSFRWEARVDLGDVRAAMEALELGPWAGSSEAGVRKFLARHKDKAALAVLLLVLLILHSLRANHLVHVRTAELTDALHARDCMEEEAKRGRERLSAMERAGILSQMSGMFAHELKQPLAAVRNYVGGLKLRQKMKSGADPLTMEVLDAIDEEVSRAAAIVERVRSYAKAGDRAHGPMNVASALRRAVDYARRHDSRCAPVLVVPGGPLGTTSEEDAPVMVWGDALELELLILNLVRNASHAATSLSREENEEPAVRVSMRLEPGRTGDLRVVVLIEDNGPVLTQEQFARLTGLGESIKQEGLGIGLSICRGIADRHGASLNFARREPHGVAARVSLPVWEDDGRDVSGDNGRKAKTLEIKETNS